MMLCCLTQIAFNCRTTREVSLKWTLPVYIAMPSYIQLQKSCEMPSHHKIPQTIIKITASVVTSSVTLLSHLRPSHDPSAARSRRGWRDPPVPRGAGSMADRAPWRSPRSSSRTSPRRPTRDPPETETETSETERRERREMREMSDGAGGWVVCLRLKECNEGMVKSHWVGFWPLATCSLFRLVRYHDHLMYLNTQH